MAKDNGNDPNKKEMKNTELMDGSKQTIQELRDRGPQRVPGPGQDFRDKHQNPSRGNIQKPSIYNEAMKAKDEQKDTTKQPDKQPDNDKDKD